MLWGCRGLDTGLRGVFHEDAGGEGDGHGISGASLGGELGEVVGGPFAVGEVPSGEDELGYCGAGAVVVSDPFKRAF